MFDHLLTTRDLLHHSRTFLESLHTWLRREDLDPTHPIHKQLRIIVETATTEIADLHARLDLDQLVAAIEPWAHPVQVIQRPRAPYGRLVEVCGARLEVAEGEEAERLREVRELVYRAHRISEQARRRREEG